MAKIVNDFQLDPLSVLQYDEYVNMDKSTFKVYKKTWVDFVKEHGISKTKEPTEKDVDQFLKSRNANGCNFNTLKSIYR